MANTWQAHTRFIRNLFKWWTFRAMTRDETKYPNPDEFRPERFIHEDGSLTSDTMSLAFGWGRRVWWAYIQTVLFLFKMVPSVGRHVADASLWIAITSFLATFSVQKALDEHGKEVPVAPKFTAGIAVSAEFSFLPSSRLMPRFSHPEKFPCRIVPRFHDASVDRLAQLTGLDPTTKSTRQCWWHPDADG